MDAGSAPGHCLMRSWILNILDRSHGRRSGNTEMSSFLLVSAHLYTFHIFLTAIILLSLWVIGPFLLLLV